mgnify:CR=1 FL=1
MKCKECKNVFHKACLSKFCRETGQCPMLCKNPRFIPYQKEIEKKIKNLKFSCNNKMMGCDKVLTYEEAKMHESLCKYALVKCEAYKSCKTKCMRKDIEMHQAICPSFEVPCIYCLKRIPRIKLNEHETTECDGCRNCPMCGLIVSRDETAQNSHNCFVSLSNYLARIVDEKNAAIELLRDELKRKN